MEGAPTSRGKRRVFLQVKEGEDTRCLQNVVVGPQGVKDHWLVFLLSSKGMLLVMLAALCEVGLTPVRGCCWKGWDD